MQASDVSARGIGKNARDSVHTHKPEKARNDNTTYTHVLVEGMQVITFAFSRRRQKGNVLPQHSGGEGLECYSTLPLASLPLGIRRGKHA